MFDFPEIVFSPIEFLPPGETIYLVGGAIRDSLLNVPLKDVDYAITINPRDLARKFAEKHHGAFFALDQERNSYRVLLNPGSINRMEFDFIQLRGQSIVDDLQERDFTINAMAIDLFNPGRIIDPFSGGSDLLKKKLTPVRHTSIIEDPVRAIRAVRYATDLGLKIDKETIGLIEEAIQRLDDVSVERKRDEIFKVLSGKHIASAILLFKRFNVLNSVGLYAREDLNVTARFLQELDQYIRIVCRKSNAQLNQSFFNTSLLFKLDRFSEQLNCHFFHFEPSGRNHKSLLLFSGLFTKLPGDGLQEMLRRFALSSTEIEAVIKMVDGREEIIPFLTQANPLSRKDIYKFFKEAGGTGIDLVFSAFALVTSDLSNAGIQSDWLRTLENAEQCVESWFEHQEIINPKPLLNGKDLMFQFDLTPGPLIGELLESMKEEQASGQILTVAQALEWVERKIQFLS